MIMSGELRPCRAFRAFPVRLPSGLTYWTVLDAELRPVEPADEFLRHLRLGRDRAESTTQAYAGAIALYWRWCQETGRTWSTAARHLGMFSMWLRHTPPDDAKAADGVAVSRGPRRINAVLAAVRELLKYAVALGAAPRWVLDQLYELGDGRHLPAEVRGEYGIPGGYAKTRHHVAVPDTRVDRAADADIVAVLRACCSARDRLIVLLMARAGLRRGEVAGLRREDIHFVPDAASLGCRTPGSHLHVVRRDNPNGAWAKSRRGRAVPVDALVIQAYDQYVLERSAIPAALASDFVLVNLFRAPVGAPMRPEAINELLTAAGKRAGLTGPLRPHMCRHAFADNVVAAGATLDELQQLLGHSSVLSSQPYLHPSEQRLREAVERVPSPREQTQEGAP
jgi:integrase/recombinase XerD